MIAIILDETLTTNTYSLIFLELFLLCRLSLKPSIGMSKNSPDMPSTGKEHDQHEMHYSATKREN